ncbi:hypothetical protein VPHD518_0005 [Vibrio phage D518]
MNLPPITTALIAGGVLAIGTWGVTTEVRMQNHALNIHGNTIAIEETDDASTIILRELSYIRGKVDTIAEQQEEVIK